MDKVEGLELLKKIIDKELVHEDYTRVTELYDKYYKMKSGDKIEELLHKIETRVSDEEFKMIKDIYRSIIPSTLNSTKMPFLKVTRKQAQKKIDYDSGADKKKAELQGYIDSYWGDKSLEKFLEYAFVDYNYIDPNAFLITEFDEFDPKKEKAKPYPFIADSKQAVMFEYKNEILQYLVVKLPIKYMSDNIEKDGYKYTMYLGQDTIVLRQIGANGIEIKGQYYELFEFQPKNEKVPAIRFGYLRDEQTKGRTFVCVFHCVIELLEKTLKIDSELDLSCAMVAFPQRFRYVTPCPGSKEGGPCKNGFTLNGVICATCGGDGVMPVHKGTQDIVMLALPKSKDELLQLSDLAYDHSPDIELLTFDKDFLENLEKKVHAKMFNADLYTRSEVATTATEKILESDNLNDTLYLFGQHYSSVWKFVVKDIATFTDIGKGIILTHQFPKDFKFKTLNELMTDLQTAKSASASPFTIAAIEDDINEILYADRPDDLKVIRVKSEINPFRGYSEANIRFIISQGNTTLYHRTLWENQESIFQDLESEHENNPWLYDMEMSKIRELVKAKVQEYIDKIKGDKKADIELNNQFTNEPFRT